MHPTGATEHSVSPIPGAGVISQMACVVVQPFLTRIVRQIAKAHPTMFARLGEHQRTDYLIDPVEFPFALHLRPNPDALILRAVPKASPTTAGATIRGHFLLLLKLLDSDEDGDAAFFSRDLTITGNTEAVVRLRNALDDVDGSIAEEAAALFGPPGRAILGRMRRRYA